MRTSLSLVVIVAAFATSCSRGDEPTVIPDDAAEAPTPDPGVTGGERGKAQTLAERVVGFGGLALPDSKSGTWAESFLRALIPAAGETVGISMGRGGRATQTVGAGPEAPIDIRRAFAKTFGAPTVHVRITSPEKARVEYRRAFGMHRRSKDLLEAKPRPDGVSWYAWNPPGRMGRGHLGADGVTVEFGFPGGSEEARVIEFAARVADRLGSDLRHAATKHRDEVRARTK